MIGANVAGNAVKLTIPAAGVAVADLTVGGIDLATAGAILLGLFAGAVLRSSRHVSEDAGWKAIRKDWLVSIMSGLANFIVAGIAVAVGSLAIPGFPVLAAAGVGLWFGWQGPDGIKWLNNRYFGKTDAGPIENVTMLTPEPERRVTKQQRELLNKLDDPGPDIFEGDEL